MKVAGRSKLLLPLAVLAAAIGVGAASRTRPQRPSGSWTTEAGTALDVFTARLRWTQRMALEMKNGETLYYEKSQIDRLLEAIDRERPAKPAKGAKP